MTSEELQRLVQILGNQIESKTTTERISGGIREDGKLIEVKKTSGLEGGGITENTTFEIKVLDCGCISQGRQNIGGVDYEGNVVCRKHFFRCARCHRPLSIMNVKPKMGRCYCRRCSFIRTIFPKR